MTTLWFDTETFCEVPLKSGVHAYAEKAEVMIAAWAVDDGPVVVEDLTTPMGNQPACPVRCRMPSAELLALLLDPKVEVVMHKSDFDRTVIRHAWGIDIPVSRIHDTMVQAMVHSLPGGLDKLSDIYQLGEDAKHKGGKELIYLFCKPLPKNQKLRRATRATHPEKWAEFLRYAGNDITAMRALRAKLPMWNYRGRERKLWELDQRINDRGFCADVAFAKAAIPAIAAAQARLKREAHKLSDGYLDSARQRDELLFYLLQEHGVDLPNMQKDTLERRLADESLPSGVRQLIAVRLAATTSSTAKYAALLRAVSADGRLRGALQFAGAKRTRRWSGRLFQPQNLPRPTYKADFIELLIQATKDGCLDLLGDEMKSLSDALRGMIIASPGMQLYSSDLANIESVVGAWLTGEQWKLDAFAEIFAAKARGDKSVADMYQRSYARTFNVADVLSVVDTLRQIGKVMELGFGFEGGVGAFLGFAAVYRLDLDKLADIVWAYATQEAIGAAYGMLEWRKRKRLTTYGLSDRVFIACEIVKSGWRDAHPAHKAYWPALDRAAKDAVLVPGRRVYPETEDGERLGRLSFIKKGPWLRMELDGLESCLCYASPQIKDGKLTYMGENQYTRQWSRLTTYGGKIFENACQWIAREVMAYNMPAIEDAGYEIVLTVHDDVIAEADELLGLTSDHLSALLATRPPWLDGCPLYASGFMAQRYRKD